MLHLPASDEPQAVAALAWSACLSVYSALFCVGYLAATTTTIITTTTTTVAATYGIAAS